MSLIQMYLEWAICAPRSECKKSAEVSSRGRRIFYHLAAVCAVCESGWNSLCVSRRKAVLTKTNLPNNAFPSSNKPLSVTQKEIFSSLLSTTLPLGFSDPNHCHSTSHVIHHREMQRQPLFDNRQHRVRLGRAASFLFWNSPVGWVSTYYAWLGHQHPVQTPSSELPFLIQPDVVPLICDFEVNREIKY